MITELIARRLRHSRRRIRLGRATLDALVADGVVKRAIGLMHRPALARGECMIFMFGAEGTYGIWMRNMMFPIDIIWVGGDMKIVDMKRSAQPAKPLEFSTYYPSAPAKYVIEAPSGFIASNGIAEGQKLALL